MTKVAHDLGKVEAADRYRLRAPWPVSLTEEHYVYTVDARVRLLHRLPRIPYANPGQ